MILEHRGDLEAFRHAIRDWIPTVLPPGWKATLAAAPDAERDRFQRWWMAELNKVGLGIAHWPAEYGGAGVGLEHQIVIADEMARAGTPPIGMFVVSLIHLPGTLIPHGSEAQKRRYLAGVARGDVWCQGFSEPNSGSDLASLRTKAVRDGDHYVINGQKIWSSYSMYARYCILLARTSTEGTKHAGISYFIMDMQAPGVEVRPIRQPTGRADFGELFLTDVRIPVEDRVGAENEGWRVAQSTLASERGVIAFESAERQRYMVEAFYNHAVATDAAWLQDDQLRREFVTLLAEVQAGRRMLRKLLAETRRSPTDASRSVFPSIVKIATTTLRQRLTSFLVRLEAVDGQGIGGNDVMFDFITSFTGTIAGGTNEIQRNIVSERGLGMPRM